MTRRAALSKKARFEVFKRDNFTCQYCGSHPPEVILEIDHIVAVANSGSTTIDNLITACFSCNRGKGASPLGNIPQSLSDKADELREREAQIEGYSRIAAARHARLESEAWRVAKILDDDAGAGYPRDQFESIRQFLQKLSVYDVLEAAEIAHSKFPYEEGTAFRYFCGVCHCKIREGAAL